MAEIFLGYILNLVDFAFKIAVIAFTAKEFGYISGPQFLQQSPAPSEGDGKKPRSVQKETPQANPLGDVFKNVFDQMAPMLASIGKPQPKTSMNFSDDVEESKSDEPSVQTSVSEVVETKI